MPKQETILISDNEQAIRSLLLRKLSGVGYRCIEASDAQQTLDELKHNPVSLLILDILDIRISVDPGLELLSKIKTEYPGPEVIVTTAIGDINIAVECMRKGAYNYLSKPFNLDDVLFSVERALEKRRLELENKEYHQHIEDKYVEQSGRVRASFLNAIRALVYAQEAKDKYTNGHSQRVADISAAIAKELGLPGEVIDKIVLAALVHDIGKIGVKESILNKQGELTFDEFKYVQKHAELGEHILSPIAGDEEILKYIRHHHGSFDGSGYPDVLKGYQIPLGARILAVADAYEAMTSERPYRKAMSDHAACNELVRCKETQFDPEVVDAFLRCKGTSQSLNRNSSPTQGLSFK